LKTVSLERASAVGREAHDERNSPPHEKVSDSEQARQAEAHGGDPKEDGCYSGWEWNAHRVTFA
jgi:hypothetical protein